MIKFSVVYSFYNEQDNIPEAIRRTRAVIQKMGLRPEESEIIFVNDNSKDKSEEILMEYVRTSPDIKLINTTRNFGNAACILAGFAFATGEYIGYLDCDLQDPPEMFERMYNLAREEKVDIVHTRRTQRLGEHPVKLFVTRIGYAILGYSMMIPIPSNVGDFKLMSRRVAQAVLQMHEPLPFIRGMISYVGFKSKTIDYIRDARFSGQAHFPVFGRRVIGNFVNNALIGYSDLPLYAIIAASGVGMAFAVFLAIYALITKLNGMAVPGTTGLILVVSVFSSLILFSIGILGLYLSSIKKAVLRRPTFLVDSTHGFAKGHSGPTELRNVSSGWTKP